MMPCHWAMPGRRLLIIWRSEFCFPKQAHLMTQSWFWKRLRNSLLVAATR